MSHKMTVSPSDDGRRLDKVIRSIWPGLPLSVVMKGIRTGSVRLDGKKAPFDARVAAGQELYVPWESPREAAGEYRYRRSLPVIYRGEGIWAVDKPVNLLVQPDRQGQDNVLDRVKYMLGLEGLEERAYAVHRRTATQPESCSSPCRELNSGSFRMPSGSGPSAKNTLRL